MRVSNLILTILLLSSCGNWNSPYPDDKEDANTLYSAYSSIPKHLDPARSYASNESTFISQIYEPPLQYHYTKRPYTLEPLAAAKMPKVAYFDINGNNLPADADPAIVAKSTYTIKIKPKTYYQPHPAFSMRDKNYKLKPINEDAKHATWFTDPVNMNKRELVAQDFVYQIKRLASPDLHSPIFGFMTKYILGLTELRKRIKTHPTEDGWKDLREVDFIGTEALDRYRYQINIKGKYPQFKLWLAMNFFAPIPWEVEEFYAQSILKKKNINLDWYPVGTGPYMLSINNPNHQMVLVRNPNFHDELYPTEADNPNSQQPLPLIDKIVFSLEKENIPLWNKFLQGYYDMSGISSDNFDYAVNLSKSGTTLTDEMQSKGIYLKTSITPTVYYLGFNMLDEIIGGYSDRARKLRQAISIAYDQEEYISIFLNGRGIVAQSPIPPGIFGFVDGQSGLNSHVYDWIDGKIKRKSLSHAKQLLTEAGYPDGIDPATGQSLKLYVDGVDNGSGGKASTDWLKRQFSKLNIQLVFRNTDYSRFQDKIKKGKAQIFEFGWGADYPDPENFLFLLYGKNAVAKTGGENSANYQNTKFDTLFEQMQLMDNNPDRLALIRQMQAIIQNDAPWVWGFHYKAFGLYHEWVKNKHANPIANNTLKYLQVDPQLRAKKRSQWNQPILLPLVLLCFIFCVILYGAWRAHQRLLRTSIKDKIQRE